MTMLALIQNDTIVKQVSAGGWLVLPNGDRVSPAEAGWSNDDCSLMTIQLADAVPAGKQIVSASVVMVEGQPKYVNVLEDIPPPDRVSSRQFKMQLSIAGLKEQVETWVAAQDELTQIAYAESGEFLRSEPMMQTGFAALGFTSAQIDAFFTAAAAL
jgi:hypothetical protein